MRPLRANDVRNATPVDGRGKRSNETLLRFDERDKLLREAAHRYCAGMSDRAAALMLRSKLLRYREGAWRRERTEELCPPRHTGRIEALMWATLKVRDNVPSERLVRAVLAAA
jgi:hypothetical protein